VEDESQEEEKEMYIIKVLSDKYLTPSHRSIDTSYICSIKNRYKLYHIIII